MLSAMNRDPPHDRGVKGCRTYAVSVVCATRRRAPGETLPESSSAERVPAKRHSLEARNGHEVPLNLRCI